MVQEIWCDQEEYCSPDDTFTVENFFFVTKEQAQKKVRSRFNELKEELCMENQDFDKSNQWFKTNSQDCWTFYSVEWQEIKV